MINHSLRYIQVKFQLFSTVICYKICNLIDTHYMQCDVTRCVICISKKLNITTRSRKRITKILPKQLYCEFKCSLQHNQGKYWEKICVTGL